MQSANEPETGMRKVYVGVHLYVDPNGGVLPRSIVWEDGRVIEIERVRFRIPRASTRVGGQGLRYTVVVKGQDRYLYDENGKWFVEGSSQ